MSAEAPRSLNIEQGNVHTRYTWACTTDGCPDYEHEWTANVSTLAVSASQHARRTGHEVVMITESRQVNTIRAER